MSVVNLNPQINNLASVKPLNRYGIEPVMTIEKNQGKPLRDLIVDSRPDPFYDYDLIKQSPAYDIQNQNRPCMPVNDIGGIERSRVKARDPYNNMNGTYPKPIAGGRTPNFIGMSFSKCDIENLNNKPIPKHSNFMLQMPSPFKTITSYTEL
tara:strand:- start:410 stop:865 length:456 start_codon:yes stop_codon:yes gene_type:complete